MEWTEKQIHYIIQDMIEENPMACSALLTISAVEFTDKVSTMAVTLSEHPVLKINMDFCRKFLLTENDIKAVLLHEFLHVLLLHTEKYKVSDPLLNIALDAIINAIIFRYKGMDYANLFTRLYKWKEMSFLLRPKRKNCNPVQSEWLKIHEQIYKGEYCADDLYELLVYLKDNISGMDDTIILLGDHTGRKISEGIKEILDGIMKKMDGTLVWNKPGSYGRDDKLKIEEQNILKYKQKRWERSALKLLKKCLLPDEREKKQTVSGDVILPVLSIYDRRMMARFRFTGIIPLSKNRMEMPVASQLATVYLDVSGSMSNEIDSLISLLYYFRPYIKMPLLVFSNEVFKARFKNGKLKYHTTGGTSISPVFDHMRKNRISKCMIVTDGYVEDITDSVLLNLKKENIRVLVSADGNPEQFAKNSIPYQQLEKQ